MKTRTYQNQAIRSVVAKLRDNRSCLIVSATGTGKSHIAERLAGMASGRVLVIGQTSEVIYQMTEACRRTGKEVGVEMAERRASDMYLSPPPIVVATVQTLNASDGRRLDELVPDPLAWSLVIIDEAHHAPAASYRKVIEHMQINPLLKLVGMTATPKRGDDVKLGAVFDDVAFDYGFLEAMNDGWLVKMEAELVTVDSLDFKSVRTTAGDLNGRDLDRVMRVERTMIGMCDTVRQLSDRGDRDLTCLVFCASVEDAQRRAEIFNRKEPGSAMMVCGKTPKPEREAMLRSFAARNFKYLTNVAIATEGWDCPQVDIVVPSFTKSWGKYVQQVGRGCRPLPGVVDNDMTQTERVASIAVSDKPVCKVIDFVGVTHQHRLVNGINIHDGRYPAELLDRVAEYAADTGPITDLDEAVEQQRERDRIEAEKQELNSVRRRAKLVADAGYTMTSADLFSKFGMRIVKREGAQPASDKQVAFLSKYAKVDARDWDQEDANKLQRKIFMQWKNNKR